MKLKEILKGVLTKKQLQLVPSSFDVVGDILIFSDFPKELEKKEKIIGKIILENLNNIKVVCKKTKKYSGEFRLPTIKIIAGERRKETEHKENGVRLKLHIGKTYFSERLGHERKRINNLIKKGETILVMFSGIGAYPINISKNTHAKKIVAIEKNPRAHTFAQINIKLNKTENIQLIKGDVKNILPELNEKFDRIIMPLPKTSQEYLNLTSTVSKKGTVIHLYGFFNESIINKKFLRAYLKEHLNQKHLLLKVTKCGQISPREYRGCLDIKVS